MAAQLKGNPIVLDTDADSLTGRHYIKLIQWVDDNADIADNDDLVLTINGQTVTIKYQKTTDVGSAGAVYYQAGPFNPPFIADSFVATTIDAGNVLIWL